MHLLQVLFWPILLLFVCCSRTNCMQLSPGAKTKGRTFFPNNNDPYSNTELSIVTNMDLASDSGIQDDKNYPDMNMNDTEKKIMTVSGDAAKLKRVGSKKMPNKSLEEQPIYAIPRKNPKKVTKSDYDKIAMELDYAIPQTNPKSVTQKNNSELVVQEKVGSVCKVTPSISHAPTKNGLDNIAYKSQIKSGSRIKARQEKTQKPFLFQKIMQDLHKNALFISKRQNASQVSN